MKRITVLSLVFALAILFGSCSVFQKNGKSTETPAKEQSQDADESYEDTNNDW